jgi:hypothetical protein
MTAAENNLNQLPRMAVGVMGSAGGDLAAEVCERVHKYRSSTRGYDVIVFTGSGLMFAGGRSGTLGEYAIAYDEGKVIGVLCGTGGVADSIEDILKIVGKRTDAVIIYETDPERLLDELELVYQERIFPLQQHIVEGHDPDGVLDST